MDEFKPASGGNHTVSANYIGVSQPQVCPTCHTCPTCGRKDYNYTNAYHWYQYPWGGDYKFTMTDHVYNPDKPVNSDDYFGNAY